MLSQEKNKLPPPTIAKTKVISAMEEDIAETQMYLSFPNESLSLSSAV